MFKPVIAARRPHLVQTLPEVPMETCYPASPRIDRVMIETKTKLYALADAQTGEEGEDDL